MKMEVSMAVGTCPKRTGAALAGLFLAMCSGLVACATHQSTIVAELSSRSRIPPTELQQLLNDCDRTQLSMNICAFRDFVASDLDLDAALKDKRESLPQCRAQIDGAQVAWEAERDKECNEETAPEEGGSMRPMLISACKTAATRARITFVKEMKSCSGGQ
ncbi:lysozyme inhibitor LprI family protein [Xanthomonas graminis]|uniref:lysozyme inhibitor LprI family protein n=1 Tax=Xanthomonas graminis TaxID=3390026 RepID=UPI0009C15E1B|nr:lysozyme inhibitor LprI family protein [Xanthomonas translucens]UKE76543.1 lysozyme inhibitor LprI family protein [Xanthomonas translucens pv. arrhenatheri]